MVIIYYFAVACHCEPVRVWQSSHLICYPKMDCFVGNPLPPRDDRHIYCNIVYCYLNYLHFFNKSLIILTILSLSSKSYFSSNSMALRKSCLAPCLSPLASLTCPL